MQQIQSRGLTLAAAAPLLGVSYRHARRIWQRFLRQGDAGLVHGARGRASNRRIDPALEERIVRRYRERYPDFGPTLASEHLTREGLKVDHETLRRWLLARQLWSIRRRRQKHRQWRERKPCFGQLVQMDGSDHDWFEGRRGRAVLMVMIDDATNRTYARFFEGETTRAAYDTFEGYVRRYGLPQALYVDRDSIYRTERRQTIAEQVADTPPLTQFGRAMKHLGVGIDLASSPQAKGRVERRNGLLQDRLVKEMRLLGLSTLEEANAYLDGQFLPEINRRFRMEAREAADAHRTAPGNLKEILSWEEERLVNRDWTVVWNGRWFQVDRGHEGWALAGKRVTVRELRDGRVQILWKGQKVRHRALEQRPARRQPVRSASKARPVMVPSADHPWRRLDGAVGKTFWRGIKARGRAARQASRAFRSASATLRPPSRPGRPESAPAKGDIIS